MRQCLSIISTDSLKILISFVLLLHPLCGVDAGAQTDSLYFDIDSTTFVSARNTSLLRLSSSRTMKVDIAQMQNLPQILGNTDPLQFVKYLPGVQTSSDWDSGIHIHGCSNAHNEISLGGVPVYGASHLLGLFSVFNPSHYQDMTYSTTSDFNRLGGMVVMELPDTLKQKVQGDISVGLMSSQGSLGLRLGSRSHLRVSARRSYLNLLYKPWLKIMDAELRYGFGDYNLTYVFVPDRKNRLWVDLYMGNDDVQLTEKFYNMKLTSTWGNRVAGLHWKHSGEVVSHKHTLFYSDFTINANLFQDESRIDLPSYIRSAGYRGQARYSDFRTNLDVVLYDTRPQAPVVTGLAGGAGGVEEIQKAAEGSLLLGYERKFDSGFSLSAWLKGSMYVSPEKELHTDLSPDLSLSYDFYEYGKVSALYGKRVQYLFQTGLSNIGFPIEFWLMAGKYGRPQKSHTAELKYELDFLQDAYSVSFGFYGKSLSNQIEYKGDLMDFLLLKYDLHNHILNGKGLNYGLMFMLHKKSGKLTGWISYAAGRALRRFNNPEYPSIYPANHERIHDLNAVCSYKMDRWTFSGTFVFASGLPFTAPEAFYISSGQIVADYGEHNSRRLRPYSRLDVSVAYRLTEKERTESGLNFSVYNILCRHNEMAYKMRINEKGVAYTPATMPFTFLPSLSYYYKF